jgi:DNA-binding NtrC family response regulator
MLLNSHLKPTEAPDRCGDSYEPGLFTVLIIDSELRYRTALNANFLRHGWQVKTAACLREAFRAIDQQVFDLVICDLQMRDGDVHQVMVALDECSPETPVIVLAANAGAPDVVKAMRNGAFDFLVKDINFDILQVAARSAVTGSARKHAIHLEEPATSAALSSVPAPALTLSELNRLHLEAALALAEGNRTNAAKVLGISVRTVRNKIRQYGLPPRRQV